MKMPAVLSERYPSKVGALFDSDARARRAADAMPSEAGVAPEQVVVIRPGDAGESAKLEPERQRIGATLVRAHVVLGLAGALVGGLVAAALVLLGPRLFAASPGMTFGLVTALGLIAGLLLGGLVSLRPDHDVLTTKIDEALRDGEHWAVVVHARDLEEERRAAKALEHFSGRIIATL